MGIIREQENRVIGFNCDVIRHRVKQQGYGRQSLYVDIVDNEGEEHTNVYVRDVFPNVREHFSRNYALSEDVIYNDVRDVYTDNGREYDSDHVFNHIEDLLNEALTGTKVYI